MSYSHLTINERECILRMYYDNKNVTEISQALDRAKSTISRELRRNSNKNGYSAYDAQISYITRRKECRPLLKSLMSKNYGYIIDGLEKYWSPEQIINHHGLQLSPGTIYRALKNGVLPTILRENLRHKGVVRLSIAAERRGKIPDCISIDDRPVEAAMRSRIGDWEADTVAGKWRTGCFMTLVDRKTRFLVSRKLGDHRAETVTVSICESLKEFPCKTLTVDNGKEFSSHKIISAQLNAPVYFSHPHSPWERPSNENTNGLLRQFFPKYMSFSKVTQEDLDYAVHLLNNRPRKCLDWKTPYQVLIEELLHLI